MVELQQKGDSTHHHFSKFILFSYFHRPHIIPFPPVFNQLEHIFLGCLTSDVCTEETVTHIILFMDKDARMSVWNKRFTFTFKVQEVPPAC